MPGYPDAQRYRVGTNYAELPVNRPIVAVNDYTQDGRGRHGFTSADSPVYAPNSRGGPVADEALTSGGGWPSNGELERAAASLHAEDDDFAQAGTLYREVFSDAGRARFIETVAGALTGIRSSEIRERAISYWTNVDENLGRVLRTRLEGTAFE